MVNDTMEYRLPGAYHYERRSSEKEDTVSLPLAIVSSVLFPSEGIMVQTTHTSLPGAWVKDEQQRQIMSSLTAAASSSSSSSSSSSTTTKTAQQQQEQQENEVQQGQQQQQQQQPAPSPSTSTTSSSSDKAEYDNQVDELRRTVAELRRKAEQLEQADIMVKKGIEIVARKRVIAQHKRRRQSEWDWCDSSCSNSSEEDDDVGDGVTQRRQHPNKKTLIFVDDEGGEWEVL
ncbi:hypothetical protein BDB00DRAFT_872690 [Zychaea mexicana]|uniref:uncharacterized protein n=1 Tax=Zychaea mexicana TaxID=64656 RepID=UPI0022FDB33B|nr:uncharacterized protein BDB00DRAFT_872690 [Zychaea mexicana]KAI9493176.1 hypothetical protein BDB00DRAFT_872690 [Zychaea mexicana]